MEKVPTAELWDKTPTPDQMAALLRGIKDEHQARVLTDWRRQIARAAWDAAKTAIEEKTLKALRGVFDHATEEPSQVAGV